MKLLLTLALCALAFAAQTPPKEPVWIPNGTINGPGLIDITPQPARIVGTMRLAREGEGCKLKLIGPKVEQCFVEEGVPVTAGFSTALIYLPVDPDLSPEAAHWVYQSLLVLYPYIDPTKDTEKK